MAHRDSDDADDQRSEYLLDNIGVAFSKLRRRTMQAPVDPPVAPTDLRRDLVLTALEEAPGVLTVNALAESLMMERSAVSRLVSWCVEQGLVRRHASQSDGRSVTLRLTQRGARTLRHSRHQQRQAFEFLTRDWPDDERLEFARLLHKYAECSSRPQQAPRS